MPAESSPKKLECIGALAIGKALQLLRRAIRTCGSWRMPPLNARRGAISNRQRDLGALHLRNYASNSGSSRYVKMISMPQLKSHQVPHNLAIKTGVVVAM